MAQDAALQMTKLVEDEERMITHAAEVPVPCGSFLCPVGRADRPVHVQCDVLQPFAVMHRVNPLSRQIRKCRAIIIHCQNLSLKPPHLARGCCLFINSPSAHNLAHHRIER